MAKHEYFAQAAPEDIGNEIIAKVDEYHNFLGSSSLVDLWRRSYNAYYGLMPQSSYGAGIFAVGSIRASGLLGEIASIKVNHYRNLLQHIHNTTTQDQTALKCKATNSDSKAIAGAYLGDGILEYYIKEGDDGCGIEEHFNDLDETANIFGESFILIDWDATAGEDYLPPGDQAQGQEQGQPAKAQKTGDLLVKVYNPFDVIRDTTGNHPKQNWSITHDIENRFDLAAKYTPAADQILTISSEHGSLRSFNDPSKTIQTAGVGQRESDLIDTYTLRHEKTDSMPQGRVTKVIGDGTVLADGPLPTRKVYLRRHAAGNIKGTIFGYTVGFDLLGIQETIDKIMSSIVTNQLSNGIQNFWQPIGNQLKTMELGGGLNLMESAVKPETLELCKTPRELFEFVPTLIKTMETLTSVSAVSRGDAPSNLKSGSALAYMATTTVTFNNGIQRSFKLIKGQCGTAIIHILTDFQVAEKAIAICGSFNRPILKKFTGGQLSSISSVYCEDISPMLKTIAGKTQAADTLLERGMIKNTQEYITMLTTGQSEPMHESEMAQIILVRSENEDMRDGKDVVAMLYDDHPLHILEHQTLTAGPDSRRDDPALMARANKHIMNHLEMEMMLQTQTPALLAIFKRGPLPFPQQQAQQPPQGGGQQPQQPQAQAQSGEPSQPRQPNMPKNSSQEDQQSYEQLQGAQQ